jgi:hypothetical protein
MAVTGIHSLFYSSEPEALRSVLSKVFGWESVDDGQDAGWLIFKMPPAELGVHPGDEPAHEISFMCDDLEATMAQLADEGVGFEGEPSDEGWGVAVKMLLPGGVSVLLYEPRHNTAI